MYQPTVRKLNRNEALLYLGYRSGDVPPSVEEALEQGEKELLSTIRPRAVYRFLPLADGQLVGCSFQPEGRDITALLSDCHQTILMAATLGTGVDTLLLRAEAQDMARAVILDALASVAAEAVCDDLEDYLRKELDGRGLHLTDRFSPGYGDMPLSQQYSLCGALDTQRRIGLTVSKSGFLLPRKSVTALMGVSQRPQVRRVRGCQHCALFRNCSYRKDGKNCGT